MRILVTGANGLLGQKLIQLLTARQDVEAIATARQPLAVPAPNIRFYEIDLCSPLVVEAVLRKTRPDVVINTAAMTNVDTCELEKEKCWQNNVTALEALVNICEKIRTRLIHLSTDFVFDGSHGPLREEDPTGPVNYYGESKLAGERVVQKSSLPWCIIRTVLVYGITPDMSRSNIVLWVKRSLESRKPIRVVNDQWRTPTLAEDLAMGCVLAADRRATGIFHVSGKDMMTPYDIAVRTADFFKLDKSLITPTHAGEFVQPARRPAKTGFIIEKARKELGFEPRSFEEGLKILAAAM